MTRKVGLIVALVALVVACSNQFDLRPSADQESQAPATPHKQPTTAAALSVTNVATPQSSLAPNQPSAPVLGATAVAPDPDAPLCPDSGEAHDNSLFHTLWDGVRGCHYDHEHGQYPFTPEVAATFPGFDLWVLLGSVGIGHTNPSSPMENTHKHGGFKWDVTLSHSTDCAGREGVPTGVDAFVAQYHAFGNYSIEFESRIHSAVALMRQCREGNPTDYGYVFANQHQDYGQRVAPYQGSPLPYPDAPIPAYNPAREPYFSVDCFGGIPPCDKYQTLQDVLERNPPADSTWISEPAHLTGSGSPLFAILFRVRDTYQMLDWNDQVYPFTFRWLCSADGGLSYSAIAGCRYNNTTTRVNELVGEIPAAWDNLAGFDTDPRVGRVTAAGFVTRFGDLNPACTAPGPDCHPLKLVAAFTGHYGTHFRLSAESSTFNPLNLPERDIYFCGQQVCAEDSPGAAPSGWLGENN